MDITKEIAALKSSYAYSPEAVSAISDATRIMSNFLEDFVEQYKRNKAKTTIK